ncbi:MAG TPA: SRPBCC domain-containing protein [Dermatophilaceae bacterium]
MIAEIRTDVIVATEHIKAPPEVVFPYFTDPALIVEWIGNRAELDMGEVVARGAYIAVEPPYRVVFSWGISGSDVLPPSGSTVEVALTPDGDDTMVALTHRGLPCIHVGNHRAGWGHRLGWLLVAAG